MDAFAAAVPSNAGPARMFSTVFKDLRLLAMASSVTWLPVLILLEPQS